MRLKNQTHGPVTLTGIRVSLAQSEETTAFTALVVIDGHRGSVRNDGRGGENYVQGRDAGRALDAYAEGLPPVANGVLAGMEMDADILLALMVDDAMTAGLS